VVLTFLVVVLSLWLLCPGLLIYRRPSNSIVAIALLVIVVIALIPPTYIERIGSVFGVVSGEDSLKKYLSRGHASEMISPGGCSRPSVAGVGAQSTYYSNIPPAWT
jgi:hypothetical protein